MKEIFCFMDVLDVEEMERWRQFSLTHLKEDKNMHGGEENIYLL